MIVAQISGRHLFEHWKDTHNFHWPGKIKRYGCCKCVGTNQEYASKIWLDCRGTEKRLVDVCFDGASVNTGVINWLQALIKKLLGPWILVVHCVNHNFELAKKRKLHV